MIEIFLINILFISACCGILTLLLTATAKVFKKRYTVRMRQILWIVLALRMALPFSIGDTWFSLNAENTSSASVHSQQRTYTLSHNGISNMPDRTQLHVVPETAAESPDMAGRQSSQDTKFAGSSSIDADEMHTAGSSEQTNAAKPVSSHSSNAYEVSEADHPLLYLCFRGIDFVSAHQGILLAIYIMGILLFAGYHLIGLWYFNRKRNADMTPVEDEALNGLTSSIAADIGLKRVPKLYFCSYAASPMVTGVMHPIILLPRQEFSMYQLRLALTHELYHIKHHDLQVKMLYFLANALHWFNLSAYVMVHEAEKDMELYCDSCVVASYTPDKRKEYNALLLHILENQSIPLKQGYFNTYFHGSVKEVKERFIHNMDKRRKKKGFLPAVATIAILLAASLLFSMQSSADNAQNNSDTARENDSRDDMNEKSASYLSDNLASYFAPAFQHYDSNADLLSLSGLNAPNPKSALSSLYHGSDGSYDIPSADDITDGSDDAGMRKAERFSMGDANLYAEPKKVSDGIYKVPIYLEDYSGNVDRYWEDLYCEGKPMTEIPMPEIFADDIPISDYGVVVNEWSGDVSTVQQDPDFFETQAAKGDANPLIYVGSWKDSPTSTLRLYFPQGQEPVLAYVEDVVLNEDGTVRYDGYPDEVVFRGATTYENMSLLTTSIAEHSSIDLYEDYITVRELVHPFYRGYRITCYWGTDDGLQSCTYHIVLRTQTTVYDDSIERLDGYLNEEA